MTSIERASRIIYLNKTCFNGLYRVNRKGEFNAPYGYSNPSIIDPIHIRAVSSFLNKASIDIGCQDFEDAVASATEGDLVYFDPPYDPLTETSNFTSYDKKGFGKEEQKRLKRVCDRLRDRGCFIVQSNSDTEFIRSLYSDYKIDSVKASRAINSKGDKRGKVGEVIIHA
jgi:DNA adenine methylase